MLKSIEEIAREDGWSEADSYFDDVLSFGELVRRSDRMCNALAIRTAFAAQEKNHG